MCLIIASDPTKTVICPTLDIVRSAQASNSDGSGMVWAHGGAIRLAKSLTRTPEENHALMEKLTERNIPWIFHARFATTGKVCDRNSHPYQLGPHMAAAHNGMLPGYGNNRDTDTIQWLRTHVQAKIAPQDIHNSKIIAKLEKIMGSGNKIAFLTADGQLSIANSDQGEYDADSGLWYSNHSYKYSGMVSRYRAAGWTQYDQYDTYTEARPLWTNRKTLPEPSKPTIFLREDVHLDCTDVRVSGFQTCDYTINGQSYTGIYYPSADGTFDYTLYSYDLLPTRLKGLTQVSPEYDAWRVLNRYEIKGTSVTEGP